jgi:protein phosphatase
MTGKNNEDAYGVAAFGPDDGKGAPVLVAVLSDGIGGHRAGEVASELAVNRIIQKVSTNNLQVPVAALRDAIVFANGVIYEQASQNPDRQGMGATCAVVLIIGERLYTATIGDSRIYLLRNGEIQQTSVDHTWIREALDAGILQRHQVENHPNAHVIRRYLGSPNPPNVDTRMVLQEGEPADQSENHQGLRLAAGDRILLCSDGLTDLVNDAEIRAVLKEHNLNDVPDLLIDMANQRGGHDNITVIVIEAKNHFPTKPRRKWLAGTALGCLGLLVVIALAIGVFFGWSKLTGREINLPWLSPNATEQITPLIEEPGIGDDSLTPIFTPDPALEDTPLPTVAPTGSIFFEDIGPTLTPWPTNTQPSD